MTVSSSSSKKQGVGLPALDVSLAFPQATAASVFPPTAWDYYLSDDLLTPEEQALRRRIRDVMETETAPVMTEYWEKAEFPYHLIPKLATLKVAGSSIKGYGCPGLSITASAIATAEIARVDASCSTFILVHSSLAMLTLGLLGSEEQKEKYLPSMADLRLIGCWGLTKPDNGSDASALKTTATKVAGGWLLNGQKRWIGNSTFADVLVIFAKNTTTKQVNAYILKKGSPGLSATKIENKIGLRMVQNGDILMKDVFVPDEDRLPGVNSFQDTNKERKQFGAPLAALQLNQEKLVRMLGNVQAMFLVGWLLCKLYESGKMTIGQAGMGKLLGGNGILADFLVAKAFCDIEPIYTYEGTYDINCLVTGREVTGIASIKPAIKHSRM
ncbi:hypothetical protein MKX01_019895 [Papaver californicum]|nr:hypothetical protein MKX01_019895 [Papaver californicum]